jgi:hypothetical protein
MPTIRECAFVSYFHFIIRALSFLSTRDPVMGFPSKWIAVNYLHPLNNSANFSSFNVCHLKISFTLSLDAINNHNWSYHFFISQTGDDPLLYKAMTFLQFLPFWGLLIISSFCEITTVSSCQQYLGYSSWDLLKPLWQLEQKATCATYNTMEIQFTAMIWTVPSKWCDPVAACDATRALDNIKLWTLKVCCLDKEFVLAT